MRPIDPATLHRLEDVARQLARTLDSVLNGHAGPRHTGFALLVFSFAGPELTWVSNADRGDMLQALREFLAKAEAHQLDELSRPKGGG